MPTRNAWNNRARALAIGLTLGLSAVMFPCWWSIVLHHAPSCSENKADFISLYTGAKLMWEDRSALYNLERQRELQKPIDPDHAHWVLPFFYPPFFAAVLAPLALVPFSAAFLAMTVINIVLLIVSLRILIRKLALNRSQAQWLVLSTLCNYGVYYALLEGQSSFLALILLVLYVVAMMDSRGERAGLWCGLMSFKPQVAVVPFLILFVKRRWREIAYASIIVACWALISFALIGRQGITDYIALTRQAAAGEESMLIQPERMHNLRALAYFFFSAPWKDYAWWGASLAVLSLALIPVRASRSGACLEADQWLSLLAALMLVTPHFHDHDLTLLILPTAIILKIAGESVLPSVSFGVIGLGMIALINTVAYPRLPPLLPIGAVIFLVVDRYRTWRASS